MTAESPHSLESILGAFGDEGYWLARLGAFGAGSPTLDSLDTDPSGRTSVAMTMRFGAGQLPDPIRRLRLATLHIVQREEWYPVGGHVRGVLTIDALRTPISGRGSVDITASGTGSRLTGTATVKVTLPLIGAAIATFVAGQLATGIVDVVRVTDSWLAERR